RLIDNHPIQDRSAAGLDPYPRRPADASHGFEISERESREAVVLRAPPRPRACPAPVDERLDDRPDERVRGFDREERREQTGDGTGARAEVVAADRRVREDGGPPLDPDRGERMLEQRPGLDGPASSGDD